MPRVYVPATLVDLAGFVDQGEVPAPVERFVAAGDDEESEYLALMSAADASTALGAERRVVLVAEVAGVDAPIPADRWVAVHADAAPGADPDDQPGWFAVQEIPALLR